MTNLPLRLSGDDAPGSNTDLTHSATTRWATFNLASTHLQDHLEETMDALLDRGVELVGFWGGPEALAGSDWERLVSRFLASGFRCILQCPLSIPLSASQLDLLVRLEEIRIPTTGVSPALLAQQNENLHLLRARFAHRAAWPPRVVGVEQDLLPFSDFQPEGHTRDCLDPWEGLVAGPFGETHPCAADSSSLGDHRKVPWSQLLNGPEAKRRRTELLSGALAASCRMCPRTSWTPLQAFREAVIRHAGRVLRLEPLPTHEEISSLIDLWTAEARRVLIYPAGNHARWFLQTTPALRQLLVGFGDRDQAKQASPFLGLPVYAPEDLSLVVTDLILVVAGDLEAAILQSLRPMVDHGIEVLAASRLHRHWQRLSAFQVPPRP